MRAVIVLLISLIVSASLIPGASDARRRKAHPPRIIVVHDYTGETWSGVVQQVVDDFNAVMPQHGPRLVYLREHNAPCGDLSPLPRDVQVCTHPGFGHLGQVDYPVWHKGRWHWSLIRVQATTIDKRRVVCHEMMHVLTNIGDNYDALPDQSCVWGTLDHPGPFDITELSTVYRRARR